MKSRWFICRWVLAFTLLGWFCASFLVPARADEVRYTFNEPGAGWEKPAFDAHDWQTAADLPALAERWREAPAPAVWVRLTQDMTWQQINNSYFRITQDGTMQIFASGTFLASNLAIRYGGHNGFFQDKDGQLRATVWKLPRADLQITLPRIETTPDGFLRPVLEDCLPPASAGPSANHEAESNITQPSP